MIIHTLNIRTLRISNNGFYHWNLRT